jgi:hypothetical protein
MNDPLDAKRCTKCLKEYPPTLEYFYADPQYSDGLRQRCKDCVKARGRQYYYEHHDERIEYGRRYMVKNRPTLIEYKRQQRAAIKAQKAAAQYAAVVAYFAAELVDAE